MRSCSRRKQYVEVVATHYIDGSVRPRRIIMANGLGYEIDEVKSVCQTVIQSTGEAVQRYTIQIKNRETFLFYSNGRWFVEMKEGNAVRSG